MINGILPKNNDTDTFLTKLSGDAYDLKSETEQFVKQLSEKLTAEQIASLKNKPELLQTMIFILFFMRFVPELTRQKYSKQLKKTTNILIQRLPAPKLKPTDLKDLASNLTIVDPTLIF